VAGTVIDQLIVKLGLDPRDFTRGEKAAAAETVKLEKQVEKSGQNMGASFVGLTRKVLGVATAALAIKKGLEIISDLSSGLRQLGIDSQALGISASELRNFGNVAEMMGGKAEDVTKTVGGLTKAVYDLAYNGQISDSLIMLGRLGVKFQDTTGAARDFKSIAMDTQTAIQTAMARGTSKENALQMLAQAGFDPGLSRAMVEGTLGAQLARQGQRRQVTASNLESAKTLEQAKTSALQSARTAGERGFDVAAKAETAVMRGAEYATDLAAGTQELNISMGHLRDTVPGLNTAIEATADLFESIAKRLDRSNPDNFPRGRQAYEATIQNAAKKFGLDPEVLAGMLGTESGFNPSARNAKSGATGIAQLMPKYFPNAGKNPYNDIYTAAEELKRLKDRHLADGNDDAAATYLALQSYNAGDARLRGSMKPGGKPLNKETIEYPEKVLGYARDAAPTPSAQNNTQNRTDITFEQVTIQTNGKDGDRIATDFVDGTRRKLNAAQADGGMQ